MKIFQIRLDKCIGKKNKNKQKVLKGGVELTKLEEVGLVVMVTYKTKIGKKSRMQWGKDTYLQ